ncbi:MAG: ABC transporter permease [Microbacteriaceae bacterium]|nr:ABC transporter permease [Microbacteriaceae bacterium]
MVSWKAPIAFAVFTVAAAVLFLGFAGDGTAEFRLSPATDAWQIPPIFVGGRSVGQIVLAILAIITIVSFWLAGRKRKTPLWLAAIFIAALLFAFLAWAASAAQTHVIPLAGLLAGALSLSVPLVYGSLAGVIGERVGVVNIAIEGQLLFGAFSSAIVASITGSPWVGLVAAAVAGTLVGMVLAVFSIKYYVDQVIVGVVLNVLVVGLTSFLYSELLAPNAAQLNTPPRFPTWEIPGLAQIPLIGPMLFRQTPIVYLAYVAVFLVWWGLFRTKWGLRLRSVGEHPTAADTVGINVNRTRFWNVSLAGAIAGAGGSFFTLGSVGAFGQEMTAGAGYIALAAVIFGKWHPLRAAAAALLFGFTTNLQNTLSIIGSPVPSEFMLMLPYVVTILAVAGFVGVSRGPAAAGLPYIK